MVRLGSGNLTIQEGPSPVSSTEGFPEEIPPLSICAYTPHAPIEISSDTEFNAVSASGTGTISDPYILEGWQITSTDASGINIHDTTVHFIIRNCLITPGSDHYAITITNVAPGTATITNTTGGIFLQDASNSTVTHNFCNQQGRNGIDLQNSPNSTVAGNICSQNGVGGIYRYNSGSSSLINNNFNHNGDCGVWLDGFSTHCLLVNNTCNGNYRGLEIKSSGHTRILNNTCNDNSQSGIWLWEGSSFSTIANNTCRKNRYGIQLTREGAWDPSTDCLVKWNFLQENIEYGVHLPSGSANHVLHHNSFLNNGGGASSSQAFDAGSNNQWYDSSVNEGNYWSDYSGTGAYLIDGSASATDPFPFLLTRPEVGLVGYWSFDEGAGDTAYDRSGNGNYGTIYGASWTNGISGTALEFTQGDWVDCGNDSCFDVGTFTIQAWLYIYGSTGGCHQILAKYQNEDQVLDDAYVFELWTDSQTLVLTLCQDGEPHWVECFSSEQISFNKWTFVTGTYNGSVMRVFINGKETGSFETTIPVRNTSSPLVIGTHCNDDSGNFNGRIDEVRIYNRSLSAEEVLSHFSEFSVHEPISTQTVTQTESPYVTEPPRRGIPLPSANFMESLLMLFMLLILGVGGLVGFALWREGLSKRPTSRFSSESKPPSITKQPFPKDSSRIESELFVRSSDLPSSKPSAQPLTPKPLDPAGVSDWKPIKGVSPVSSPIVPTIDDKRALFSSIQYRVQDIIYEQSETDFFVRLIPYFGSIKEMTTQFDRNQIIMRGWLEQRDKRLIKLELKIDESPTQFSYDEPWRDITLIGNEDVIQGIKQRREIANRLISLGTALVKVESPPIGRICIQITSQESKETINNAFFLLQELQSFIDDF